MIILKYMLLTFFLLFIAVLKVSFGESVFERLNLKLQSLNTIKAHFKQETTYSWYPEKEISEGSFFAKKGKKFRIEYTHPEKVLIISDGREIMVLNFDEREAFLSPLERSTSPTMEALLFFSRPINEVFSPIKEEELNDGYYLELEPKEREENLKKIIVKTSRDLTVRSVEVIDGEGTVTRLIFHNIVENEPLSDSLFIIEIPEGVRVRREERGLQ